MKKFLTLALVLFTSSSINAEELIKPSINPSEAPATTVIAPTISAAPSAALARTDKIMMSPSNCKDNYQKTHYIDVNITSMEDSYSAAKAKYDDQVGTVENLAKMSGLKTFKLQNSSINISPNYGGYGMKKYNLSLYYSYSSEDNEDQIFRFLQDLEAKGIQASYRSNTNIVNYGMPCPNMAGEAVN